MHLLTKFHLKLSIKIFLKKEKKPEIFNIKVVMDILKKY